MTDKDGILRDIGVDHVSLVEAIDQCRWQLARFNEVVADSRPAVFVWYGHLERLPFLRNWVRLL